jgi:hypothetical protein
MTNYLSQMPDEIIDIILLKCNESYDAHLADFVRYEYIMEEPMRKIYHEYTGTMKNGVPRGRGIICSSSRYINNTAETPASLATTYTNQVNQNHPTFQNITTAWLYKPFLYVIHNCSPLYKIRYTVS